MLAFHGDKQIKLEVLTQLKNHYKLDEIIKGKYWEKGKGCAVGCTIHSSDYSQYEYRFGIPRDLAALEDIIFEGLSNDESKEFPIEFIKIIKPGADLSNVYKDFLAYILIDEVDGVINCTSSQQSKNAIKEVSEIFTQNITDINEIQKRRLAAYYATTSAYYATTSAYYAADAANAAYYAANTAYYAADAANAAYYATTSAYYTTTSAYYAANATYYAADAANAAYYAKQRYYSNIKTKLLQLLKDCK